MYDQPPRFLRHRTADKVFEMQPDGHPASMPSDDAALEEFITRIDPEVSPVDVEDPFDESQSKALSRLLLIDSPDGEPIAYSPPHYFGKFWIVPRLWLYKDGKNWTLLAPYPHTGNYRPHHVLRVNRGKRMTTLERDDCSMVVIAPPLAVIADQGGISRCEGDGIKLSW